MSSLLRLILGDPDGRSPSEVRRDVDDELECHLQMLREDLRGEGLSEERAREEAERRFGDVERYRKLCADVALKERRVLARINLVLLVIVMVGVGVLSWRSFASQARTAEAVERLSLKIEQMGAGGGGGGAGGAANAAAPGRGETLAGGEVKVDRFGRAAEMQFTEQMRAKNQELRAEMFRVYDEKCTQVGYSTLRGRTETVLVVGEVERPGVYDLTKVKRARAEGAATMADVLRAAGVKGTARGVGLWGQNARLTNAETFASPAELWARHEPVVSGEIIDVMPTRYQFWYQDEKWWTVAALDARGKRSVIAERFSDSVFPEIMRAERYREEAWKLRSVRRSEIKDKAEKARVVIGEDVATRELIESAVDLANEDQSTFTQRLLLDPAVPKEKMTLSVILADQQVLKTASADELNYFERSFLELHKNGDVRVRVIDRLSGKKEAVLDLPWHEAKASQAVVMPGSLVVFSNVKKDGAEKTSP
ncbi:MAG: hypothetical protein IBJ18_11695 [Phycisphaerales bacterium]|nr:hypothetical protein [Phycisphaerales bacterium]